MIAIGLAVIALNLAVMICCCKASGKTERCYEEWMRK